MIKETAFRIKAIREEVGYSVFDAAMKSINRERLENGSRPKRVSFRWAKYTALYRRCNGKCWWCQTTMPLIKGKVEVDHFDPNEQDFNGDSNLGLLHSECNREKGAKSLTEQAEYLGITIKKLIERFRG